MSIRTTLPIAAIATVGMALAGCVAPSTRVTQLQPSQQEKPQLVAPAPPKVQPLPELPEVQLPSERVLGGVETGEWLPGVDLSKILINPTGPEADPYLQHYPPVLVVPAIDEVLEAPQSLWLPGTDLRQVDLTMHGPEADPTLQHRPQALARVTGWLPGTDLRQVDLTMPGPEADPALQHYNGPLPVRTQPSWLPGVDLRTISIAPIGPPSELALAHRESVKPTPWLPGADLRLIDLTLPGPEADPYLQHRIE